MHDFAGDSKGKNKWLRGEMKIKASTWPRPEKSAASFHDRSVSFRSAASAIAVLKCRRYSCHKIFSKNEHICILHRAEKHGMFRAVKTIVPRLRGEQKKSAFSLCASFFHFTTDKATRGRLYRDGKKTAIERSAKKGVSVVFSSAFARKRKTNTETEPLARLLSTAVAGAFSSVKFFALPNGQRERPTRWAFPPNTVN